MRLPVVVCGLALGTLLFITVYQLRIKEEITVNKLRSRSMRLIQHKRLGTVLDI